MANSVLANLINPQVMADMISANVGKKVLVAPIAKVDNTLEGVPGDTITVPQYAYVGDAEDVAEGVACGSVALTATSANVTVKKAMKGITITDEAALSGYGDPVGQATKQLTQAIAGKVDTDCMEALLGAQLVHDGTAAAISYSGVVSAIDLFDEEVNTEKVMFIAPAQVGTLRNDANFTSNDKYPNNVMMTGEIGRIGNARIVPSKRVVKVIYTKDNSNGTITITADNLPTYKYQTKEAIVVGDKIKALASNSQYWLNPIVSVTTEEDEAAALTIYLKKDTNVETERHSGNRTTEVTVDKHYAAALTNTGKVVLAKFKA